MPLHSNDEIFQYCQKLGYSLEEIKNNIKPPL